MTTRRLAGVRPVGTEAELLQYFLMCDVWALGTYAACDLRCGYCISYAQGPSVPRVPVDEVAGRLAHELAVVPPDETIAIGAIVDCYPHAEAQYGATRAALAALAPTGHPLVVITKGTGIVRDLDLLAGRPRVSVNVSLPSLDDEVLQEFEPQAPCAAERLAVIEALHDAGVAVQLHVQPWIPGATDAAAMIDWADGRLPVCFGPLGVQSPTMAAHPLARRFTQAEINRAYRAEMARLGDRPGVAWQRPPWLNEADAVPTSRPGEAASNAATIRWMIETLDAGTFLLTALEVLSPHVRGHDVCGLTGRPGHPRSGAFRDLLNEVMRSLDDHRFVVTALDADGDRVHVRVRVTGRHARPLLGRSPTGGRLEFDVANTYRFDGNGLIVEYWQDSTLGEVLAPAVPEPPGGALGCAPAC